MSPCRCVDCFEVPPFGSFWSGVKGKTKREIRNSNTMLDSNSPADNLEKPMFCRRTVISKLDMCRADTSSLEDLKPLS